MIAEKALGHGDARVNYGKDRPKYSALRRTIQSYYADLLRPLERLQEAALTLTSLKGVKADEPFRYTAAQRRALDTHIDVFLASLAGHERDRDGFVEGGIDSDTPDGIIQQHDILAHAVGLRRASDLLGVAITLQSARQSPGVKAMLDNAFTRLSEGGELRLEGVRDEIHGVLVGAHASGISPLETARQLSAQFDEYSSFEFQRLARTESAFAAEEGTREQFREFGVGAVQWLVSAGACAICQGYVGQVIAIDDEDNQPPAHPNCLCTTIPFTANLLEE